MDLDPASKYVHFWYLFVEFQGGTLDGRNPAPGDIENIPLFTWFYTSRVVVWISSINSITKRKCPIIFKILVSFALEVGIGPTSMALHHMFLNGFQKKAVTLSKKASVCNKE